MHLRAGLRFVIRYRIIWLMNIPSVLGRHFIFFSPCVFALQCKLEQQACLTGKDLTLKCTGLCPCTTAAPTLKENKRGTNRATVL